MILEPNLDLIGRETQSLRELFAFGRAEIPLRFESLLELVHLHLREEHTSLAFRLMMMVMMIIRRRRRRRLIPMVIMMRVSLMLKWLLLLLMRKMMRLRLVMMMKHR